MELPRIYQQEQRPVGETYRPCEIPVSLSFQGHNRPSRIDSELLWILISKRQNVMIKILRKLATAMLPVLLCGTLLAGCEEDYKYAKVDY